MVSVSIIMPVYNSSEYLSGAISSILKQDFEDFELLLIDDGSTDGSGIICDEAAASDHRVRVFHKPNGGMCNARNFALRKAKGTFVTFCDNDDEYLPHLLSDNVRILIETGADCVRFGRRIELYDELNEAPRTTDLAPLKDAVFSGNEISAHYNLVRSGSEGVWACIYRKETIDQIGLEFDERLRHGYEDVLFNIHFLNNANMVATNANVYYKWIRRSSHSSSFNIAPDYKLGLESAIRLEHDTMMGNGSINALPGFYADKMVSYLLTPLETSLLAGTRSYGEELPLYQWLQAAFQPYKPYVLARPLSAPKKVMSRLILNGHFRSARLLCRLAAVYLSRSRRQSA